MNCSPMLLPQKQLKPLSAAHSIWEIVLHIIAWERVVYNGLTEKENSHAGKNDWLIQPTAIRCWNLSKGAQSVVVRGGEAIQHRPDILLQAPLFETLQDAAEISTIESSSLPNSAQSRSSSRGSS